MEGGLGHGDWAFVRDRERPIVNCEAACKNFRALSQADAVASAFASQEA